MPSPVRKYFLALGGVSGAASGTGIKYHRFQLLLACQQARGVLWRMLNRAEEMRIRYQYRKMILSGKARISLDAARALAGPDCAYHLYGLIRPAAKGTSPVRLR